MNIQMSISCPTTYSITWNNVNSAVYGGYFNITVNGTVQVYDTSTSNSGSVTVSIGDTVNIYGYGATQTGVYAYANITIDGTNYFANSLNSVLLTQSFTVSGNHTVNCNIYDGL
jgi:hypothetical protein